MTFSARLASFAPRSAHKLGLIAVAGAALLSNACVVTTTDNGKAGGSGGSGGPGGTQNPVGPVAHNASEAFPDKPASVPVLSSHEIVQACISYVGCSTADANYTFKDRMAAMALCVTNVTWSAERAIPMSDLALQNERPEYFVGCVNQHAGDCSAVNACSTSRDPAISCQEDGCQGPADAHVTCQGTVASLETAGRTITRDCAAAYAECDPSSPTGCTDRQYTACPAGDPHVDRCDGNVRLGCDGTGQVSYHDCSRMGGTCGTTPDGHQDCIYTQGSADPSCTDGEIPTCSGTKLDVCVNGRLMSVDAPSLCIG